RDAIVVKGDSVIGGELDLEGSRVDTVELGGGEYGSVNLSGAEINSKLSFGSGRARAKWLRGGHLNVVHTHAGSIEDRQDAWPTTIEFDGFTYDRWGASEPF